MDIKVKARFVSLDTNNPWCTCCAVKAIMSGIKLKLTCKEYDPEYEFDECAKCGIRIESGYMSPYND